MERRFSTGGWGIKIGTAAEYDAMFTGQPSATFWVIADFASDGSGRRAYASATSGVASTNLYLGIGVTNRTRFQLRVGGTGVETLGPNSQLLENTRYHFFGICRDGTLELWAASADGVALPLSLTDSNASQAGNTITFDRDLDVALGSLTGDAASSNRNWNGGIVVAGAWTRALSEQEMQGLVRNPFSILERQRLRTSTEGPQTIAVGTLAETDALVGITPVKPIIVGVGVIAEIDSLVPVVGIKIADIGTLVEAGSLIPVQASKVATIGTLGETDALVVIQVFKPIITAVGILGETDDLISALPIKVAAVGTLGETDALVSIQALKPIIKAIGTPSESETAQVVIPVQGQLIVVGTASEAETAQAIIALKPIITVIGFASETEVAQAVAVIQPGGQEIAVGTAIEVEVSQAVGARKSVVIEFVSETEAAQAVIALKPIIQAIATVAEVENAQGVAAIKPIITPVGTAVETEAAQIVRYIKVLQIGTATETEVPITVTIIKIVLVGQVSETELAQIVVPGIAGLGDAGVLLTADDTGKAVAVVVVSKVAVLYDVVKIRS